MRSSPSSFDTGEPQREDGQTSAPAIACDNENNNNNIDNYDATISSQGAEIDHMKMGIRQRPLIQIANKNKLISEKKAQQQPQSKTRTTYKTNISNNINNNNNNLFTLSILLFYLILVSHLSQLLLSFYHSTSSLSATKRLILTSDALIIRVRSREEAASGSTPTRRIGHSLNSRWLATSANGTQPSNGTGNNFQNGKLMEIDAFGYLQRYGYVNETMANANLITEDAFSEAVMTFQRFAGIPETGIVDGQTIKFMQMPRCGNKDMSGKGAENGKRKRRRRKKRYALQGSKWRRQELTYRISQYPTKFLSRKHEVDRQIERAFKIWSQVAPIDFVVSPSGKVHIDIRFASGEHGDGDPFDGPGNTLAHAYFPQYGGDAHFDDQEYWTVDSYAGTNIFQVAAHELGHSLGLGHSSVREALMAPFYQKYKPNFKLHPDDVLAIQALYGERTDSDYPGPISSTSTTTSTSTSTTSSTRPPHGIDDDDEDLPSSPAPAPRRPPVDSDANEPGGWFSFGGGSRPVNLCQESKIDAITRTEDGNTYVFRNQHYWQITNEGLATGYPARIARDWDGLPGNLDAALTWSDGKTFFFKGDKYWRFFNKRREPGYPKQISVGFAGIPNYIDAAFVWSGNGKTYFFKRDKYWRFDSKQDPPVSSQYPKPLRNWSGLPLSGVDAAFKWENGLTYFFKDDLYYRFDDREFEVDASARPSFPRPTSEWWFGCTNSNLPLKRNNDSADTAIQHSEASGGSINEARTRNNNPADQDHPLAIGPSIKPRGNSLSRSILNSLNALFPSSSSSSSTASPSEAAAVHASDQLIKDHDWSFHRGLAEETNRVFRLSTRAIHASSTSRPVSLTIGRRAPLGSRADRDLGLGSLSLDSSRWAFPQLDREPSIRGIAREQSLSELRANPNSNDDDEPLENENHVVVSTNK